MAGISNLCFDVAAHPGKDSTDVAAHPGKDSTDVAAHPGKDSTDVAAHPGKDSTDVAAHPGKDSTDVAAHPGKDSTDVAAHTGKDSTDMAAQVGSDSDALMEADTDSTDVIGHGATDSTNLSLIPSPDAVVNTNTDPTSDFHENTDIVDHENTDLVDHEKISSTIAVDLDHSYTESTDVVQRSRTSSIDSVNQTHTVTHENMEVAVSESTSHTEALEDAFTNSADVDGHADTTSAMCGLESISSTNIVDCAYIDTLDVGDNVIAYSTSVVDGVKNCTTDVIHQASTFAAKTDLTANQADTDSKDVCSGSSQVDSAVKKSHISRGSSIPGHQRVPTPAAVKEARTSVPDLTPSRRSSRKKQSTFSSDFEYYALGNMKIEIKSETIPSYKPSQRRSEAQDDDSSEQSESDDDSNSDKTKLTKMKVAEKKHKGKVSEADDSEEDRSDTDVQFDKGKVKIAGKKKTPKFNTITKGIKKKRIRVEEEESEDDEDSDADVKESRVTPKLLKGHKRKKYGGFVKVESKKLKVKSDEEDESSDEEESTPISLLKAKLKEESTPISQLKDKLKEESIPISKLKAELKEESIPISKLKAKLEDSNPVTKKEVLHSTLQLKIQPLEDSDAISQLQAQIRQKREVEKKAMNPSSQGRSLMERLADGSLDLSVDYERSLLHSQKRKLMSEDVTDQVPSKISKSIQIDKLAPALANLVKLHTRPSHELVKSKSLTARPETSSNSTCYTQSNSSSAGNSAAGSSHHKQKVKNEGGLLKKSESGAKKSIVSKAVVSKSDGVKGDRPKHPEERKSGREDKLVPKKEVRYVTKVKVIRKPDGTIIKKKVLVPEHEIKKLEESKIKKQYSPEKNEGKKISKIQNTKHDPHHKSAGASGNISNMKHNGKLDSDVAKKKIRHEFCSKDSSQLKHQHGLKTKGEDRKHSSPNLTVDDLLKRGVFHKKKRHQPFGNKNLPKPAVKDLMSEAVKDDTKTEVEKEPKFHKKGDKLDVQKLKVMKSSDVHKRRRDRSHSSDSGKGRRKLKEAARKKLEKPSDVNQEKEDEPPVLIPASSLSKPKHKHHKVEHEIPVDMTMNDLFKPDLHLQEDLLDSDMQSNNEICGLNGKMSHNSADAHDVQPGVKSEHVYNIMMEHQYSKPASPVAPGQDGHVVDGENTRGDDDIESLSHAQTVLMDVNLPDQFLEESDEPVANDMDDYQDTWPDTMEELQHMVDRRDTADRASILESLGSELEESGTEFLIVGQVEVGRAPALLREDRQSTHVSARGESQVEPDNVSSEGRKTSTDNRKQSLDKSRDSTDKRSGFTDGERRPSAKDNKTSSEDRKSSVYDRKSASDKKDIADYKKSGYDEKKKYNTDEKKKYSSDEKKKYSSDDRRKSTSDDKKKASSESKRSSVSEKKGSHEDKSRIADDRSDNVDKKKYKDGKKTGSTELKPQENDEMDDDSGEEQKFKDDENDIDWEPHDTDTLYCICRKPHNNRFMICCDKCEEWFHGTCVGVSRARGKEMEDNEEEYICPFCSKGEHDLSMEKLAQSSKSPDKVKVKSKLLDKCVGRKCNKPPRSGSVYCSNECVMSHAQEALKAIREEHVKTKMAEKQPSTQSKSSSSSATKTPAPKSSQPVDTVEVIERETGKLLTGPSAPTQKGLHRWLEQHPTFEVILPHKHRSKSSSSKDKNPRSDKDKTSSSADKDRHKSDKDRKRVETEKRDSTSSKDSGRQSEADRQQNSQTSDGSRIDDKRGDGQKQIRVNVQAALGDCLAARALEADDIMLSSNEIKSLAVTIEEELFSIFNDTGHKYRTKYRSLVFNIKDQKNKGLFRKILTGKINPHKLVQMSTEELASRELAKWREQASKHQLDMIQKTEQQALKESEGAKHMRKKTHKGEVEVEEEDLSILETRLEEKKDPEPELQEEQPQVPVIDTTDQHRAHLFDLNCKVCTGKIVPGREEQVVKAAPEKPATVIFEQPEEKKAVQTEEDKEDYEKAEEIVKEAFRMMQKMEKSVSSLTKIVPSPAAESATPPLSPKLLSSRRESSPSSSTSSTSSSSIRRKVVVRSPDSALQSGLEAKSKFTPTGPMLWKGFMSMLDVAKFFTSAYRVSGPTEHIVIPDTINILGRISPEHMWDYLSKIRQAGSKDLTIVRFIPGNDDEKVAYIHLYSYLNSRGRCGVAANTNKQIKDFYIIPLASHSKLPRTLLPFDGPGLEENRPHMLIGVLVRQRGKTATETPNTGSAGKSGTQSTAVSSGKSGSQSSSSSSGKSSSHRSTASRSTTSSSTASRSTANISIASSSTKQVAPVVSRDPRLAKFAAREAIQPTVSPAESSIYVTSSTSGEAIEEYEPEYVPMPVNTKHAYKPVAEYIPTPTVKKQHVEKDAYVDKKERKPQASDLTDRNRKYSKEKYRHHREKKVEKKPEIEDDSDPYSPGKEAEPYSPGQEAAADEPYDPADGSLMDETDVSVISSTTVSSSTVSTSSQPAPAAEQYPSTSVAVNLVVAEPPVVGGTEQKDNKVSTLELIEKMAHSNDPQEISAFMVTALSSTSSATEQQKMLVELTSKVEERKLQLADTARFGREEDDRCKVEGEKLNEGGVSSSFVSAEDVSQIPMPSVSQGAAVSAKDVSQIPMPSVSQGAAVSTVSEAPTNLHGMVVESSVEQTVSSSLLPSASLPASMPSHVVASEVGSSESEPRVQLETTHSQDVDQCAATVNTQAASSGDIPDALKALINDIMGNTQVSSLEMRRRKVLKKEVQKVDIPTKEVVREDGDSSVGQLLDKQAEAQKRLMDEAEALKILETVKKLEQTGSGVKLEHSSSNLSDGGCVTAVTAGGSEFVPKVVDTMKETPSNAPSVNELLEKLKSGGFQFPLQKVDNGGLSSTLVQKAVAIPSDSLSSTFGHSELPATSTATLPSLVPPTVSTSAAVSSNLSSSSALDLDLRHKADLPGSSKPTTTVSSSSTSVHSKTTDYKNYSSRPPATFLNQDDAIFYHDRDDRLPRSSAATVPKHPLDPYAFPPLPGNSRTYLTPARSNLPLGPLHPRFPLPSTHLHANYDATPPAGLHPRASAPPPPPGTELEKPPAGLHPRASAPPPPPGTELEKPPAGLGSVDNLAPSDVDFRNRSRTASFQERLSPPLSVQPSLPVAQLPGNLASNYPSQVPADLDLRGRDSYRPPHTHHTGHHGRGRDRPYQRH